MWSKAENDQECRQFARDVSNMFKKEMERAGTEASAGIEGGASVRGKNGAVMLYGNYDVSDLPEKSCLLGCADATAAIRRDLARHLRRQLFEAGEAEGAVRSDEYV